MKEALLTASQVKNNVKVHTANPVHAANTVFFCPEESQFYSQCIEKMVINQCSPLDSIVEFGTGDGSPVIRCLLKANFQGRIHGYELSAASCEVAQSKIDCYQLHQQFTIHNQCFFTHIPQNVKYLIANPPYLPAPDNELYMPSLHGGTDGATITKQLLSLGCENAMLMISAYSNPVETVEHAIAQGYQVVDFMISPLQFGYYSREPKVRQAISELRDNNQAFYSKNIYFLAGVLFRQADRSTVDLSEEFLKVMTAL